MSFTSSISIQLEFDQLVEIVQQLPAEQQERLQTAMTNGKQNGALQKKVKGKERLTKGEKRANKKRFLKGLEEAIAEVKAYERGEPHGIRPLKEVLDELRS